MDKCTNTDIFNNQVSDRNTKVPKLLPALWRERLESEISNWTTLVLFTWPPGGPIFSTDSFHVAIIPLLISESLEYLSSWFPFPEPPPPHIPLFRIHGWEDEARELKSVACPPKCHARRVWEKWAFIGSFGDNLFYSAILCLIKRSPLVIIISLPYHLCIPSKCHKF